MRIITFIAIVLLATPLFTFVFLVTLIFPTHPGFGQEKGVTFDVGTQIFKDLSFPDTTVETQLSDYRVKYEVTFPEKKIWTLTEKTASGWQVMKENFVAKGTISSSVWKDSKQVYPSVVAEAIVFSAKKTGNYSLLGNGSFYTILSPLLNKKTGASLTTEYALGEAKILQAENLPGYLLSYDGILEFPCSVTDDLKAVSLSIPVMLGRNSVLYIGLQDKQVFTAGPKSFMGRLQGFTVRLSVDDNGAVTAEEYKEEQRKDAKE